MEDGPARGKLLDDRDDDFLKVGDRIMLVSQDLQGFLGVEPWRNFGDALMQRGVDESQVRPLFILVNWV